MCLTVNEQAVMQAFYDYSRAPVWVLDEGRHLLHGFFSEPAPGIRERLSAHIAHAATDFPQDGFGILCRENELYALFSFRRGGSLYHAVAGPLLLAGFYPPTAMRSLSFAPGMNTKELESLVVTLPVVTLASFGSLLRMLMLLLKMDAPDAAEIENHIDSSLQDSLKRNLAHDLFENRSDLRMHTPYSHELAVLNCVKEGNVAKLESVFKALPGTKYGNMSSNPLRQLFYGCIAATTLVTRYAIEGGLDEETAFTLSDVYIRQMESCKTLYELNRLNEKMAVDFTQQVARVRSSRQPSYTEPVSRCVDYIRLHIQEKISLDHLARLTNLTPKYLSRLFRGETGQTLSSFIESSRIDEAKSLLVYSRYSYSRISEYLSFSSHSYFISVFKRRVGMTPREFRLRYSQASWEIGGT
jgi:AraC-like DNA-binding protein